VSADDLIDFRRNKYSLSISAEIAE